MDHKQVYEIAVLGFDGLRNSYLLGDKRHSPYYKLQLF